MADPVSVRPPWLKLSHYQEIELSCRDTIYSQTTLHMEAEPFEKDLPFQMAIIELEEGPRLTARIEGEPVAIGDSVQVTREADGVWFFTTLSSAPTPGPITLGPIRADAVFEIQPPKRGDPTNSPGRKPWEKWPHTNEPWKCDSTPRRRFTTHASRPRRIPSRANGRQRPLGVGK